MTTATLYTIFSHDDAVIVAGGIKYAGRKSLYGLVDAFYDTPEGALTLGGLAKPGDVKMLDEAVVFKITIETLPATEAGVQ